MAEETPKKSSSKGSIISILVVVIVIALGIWYFSSGNGAPSQNTDATGASAQGNTPGNNGTSSIPTFSVLNIKAQGSRFVPDTLTVKKGNPVMINFTAADATYDLMFQDPKIGFDVVVKKGEMQTFGFDTSDKNAGSYTFMCNTDCGGASSSTMRGTLTIQ